MRRSIVRAVRQERHALKPATVTASTSTRRSSALNRKLPPAARPIAYTIRLTTTADMLAGVRGDGCATPAG
ncbi:hypothetical protein O7622_21960 [Micromonospora sp. WMMD1076]|uniref:hypothetical protein n=1 Tax=Micromonospora sp. WMMD1076 TaxID=3016103 RepID=UPI00249B9271|nr:hypothetical protein [Micromonospora sp. WMMD1076]WFF05710.1 hypothetical protein O7622_21960 [Micromonospora sp. WMMD1076]